MPKDWNGRTNSFRVDIHPVARLLPAAWLIALTVALSLDVPAASPLGRDARADSLIDVWQTEQGLPQNHITSITQTRDGYLWLGTYEGLSRFDGVRFVNFHAARHPELQSSRITSLFEDGNATLWIGHEHGQVTRFIGNRFESVPLPSNSGTGSIIGIQDDDQSDVWFLRRNGTAIRLRDGHVVPSSPGPTLPTLSRQPGGQLWRTHSGRLTSLMTNPAGPPGDYPRTNDFVINTCPSADGSLWVLTGERLRKWSPGAAEVDLGPVPFENHPVPRLLESRSGRLWIGTQDLGLFIREPDGTYIHFDRSSGLPSDWVRSLREDREGTVWVGTGGGGLCAIRQRRVHMVQAPDEWQGRGVLSISPDPDGALWIGTEGAGLYRMIDGQFERFGSEQGLANQYVWSVLAESPGSVWVGTWGRGLFQQMDTAWVPWKELGREGIVVTALHRGRDGALWIGTQRGLARMTRERLEWFGRQLTSPEVRCLAEMDDGTVWFGMSGGGLAMLRNGQIRQFLKADGLPSNDVWSLLPAGDALWIGTVGGGLCRWRNDRFAILGEKEGLPNDVVCQILQDDHGHLWLGTRGGIVRTTLKDLEACADGLTPAAPFFTYGKSDGLATLECSGGFQPSSGRTRDGRIWIPTTRGLAVVDPSRLSTNPLAPPLRIESLQIDGRPAAFDSASGEALKIPPGRRRFDLRFTALSFVAPERIRFRYRLHGLEEGWTESSSQRQVSYSFLPPGDYVFRVTACNSDGVWNSTGASLAFTVLPHFWQTLWFQISAGLVAAGTVGGAVRFITRRRYRQKLERMERQRAIERERSRIARDIHDDLGASLTRITLLSQTAGEDLEDRQMVEGHLQRIYATARELTKAMEEIVWAVNPQHDTLDSLVTYLGRFAQDLASAAGLRCRIHMPTELPAWPLTAEIRHNLFLAMKEALNNAVRHADASEIQIHLTLAEKQFVLALVDDGKGFDPGRHLQGASPAGGGNGLANMRRRMEELGGHCTLESTPSKGTTVRFSLTVAA